MGEEFACTCYKCSGCKMIVCDKFYNISKKQCNVCIDREQKDKTYEEIKNLINITSFLRKDEDFYDMSCKHQMNFLINSLDGLKELLDGERSICEILESLDICPKSLDYVHPHTKYECVELGCS